MNILAEMHESSLSNTNISTTNNEEGRTYSVLIPTTPPRGGGGGGGGGNLKLGLCCCGIAVFGFIAWGVFYYILVRVKRVILIISYSYREFCKK